MEHLEDFALITQEVIELNQPVLTGLDKYARKKAKLSALASVQRTLTAIADRLLATMPEGEEKAHLQRELQLMIFRVREKY